MRTSRPILLAAAAAALLAAGACSRDTASPAGPTIAGSPTSPSLSPFSFSTSAATDTTTRDSVIGGYGGNPCGGLDYQEFEYDPDTGTEYVVCPDTTPDSPDPAPAPAPVPAPVPAPAPKAASGQTPSPTPTPAPEDSVTAGYGNPSTPPAYPRDSL